MESNTLSTSETQCEYKNRLECERYAKCISCTVEKTADAEEAEQRQSTQKQAYAQQRASESTEEAIEITKGKLICDI
ncbi:16153_t:CDS:2 [Gigaspora rosea]|nr:16153_t:CDS:2 [Gigaspora rosea]